MQQIKPLPYSIEREETILGAMVANPKIKPKVSQLLNLDDFYREAHQHIFNAILNSDSDLIEIVSNLEKSGHLEKVGGSDYIADMLDKNFISAGWKHHCNELKQLSMRRKLICHCMTFAEMARSPSEEIEALLEDHKAFLREIQSDQTPDFVPNIDIVSMVCKDMEARAQTKNGFAGIKLGFWNIDSQMYGIEPGTVTIIMARPSTGKTAFALNIADNIDMDRPNERVLYFNLESSSIALTRRRLASCSGVPLSGIRRGKLSDTDMGKFLDAANTIASSNLIILEKAKYKDIKQLRSQAETLSLTYPISAIVVDHFHKLKSSNRTHSMHHEYKQISNDITTIAKELNVPVILLCQMNREFEKRGPKARPQLSDLRETGSLEEDMDNIISLYREDKESDDVEVELLKGKDVGTFKTFLKFDRYTQRFSDCDDIF